MMYRRTTYSKLIIIKVPKLDLNSSDFPSSEDGTEQLFISVVDRFLDSSIESGLQSFKLNYSRAEIPRSKDLIGSAVSLGIRSLDLESNTFYRESSNRLIYPGVDFMPLNLYESETLVSLKLAFSGLEETFVSLPCLRLMDLRQVHYDDPMNLEKLLSGCLVLEELTYVRALYSNFVDRYTTATTRVRSRSLKRLNVPKSYGVFCCTTLAKHTFEIDAPGLEYMSLQEDHFDRIVVKNLTSLSTIYLKIKFVIENGESFDQEDLEKRYEIRDFLNGIVSVRHMIISHQTVEALERYSKVGLIRIFKSLSRLEAKFPSDLLEYLPAFLESFPNLKLLILKIVYTKNEAKDELVGVPRCFDSTLECVEVRGFYYWEEDHEKNIASYFIENSAFLKKLTLCSRENMRDVSSSEICEELNNIGHPNR